MTPRRMSDPDGFWKNNPRKYIFKSGYLICNRIQIYGGDSFLAENNVESTCIGNDGLN